MASHIQRVYPSGSNNPSFNERVRNWIVRLLASYLMFLTINVATESDRTISPAFTFTDKTFGASLTTTLLITAVFYALFSLLAYLASNHLRTDGWVLAISITSYGVAIAYHAKATYTALLIAGLACFAIAYLFRNDMLPVPTHLFKKTLCEESGECQKSVAYLIVGALFFLFAFYVSLVTVIRYLNYSAPNFDFGLFVNMFHNMKETGLPNVTSERDMLLSHFAVHISPIYYLLLPFYMLFPTPETLQIGQAVIVASGVIPLYRIVRSQKMGRMVAAGFCTVYALYPALSGGCMYDLHENCFLAPLLLWTFDACLRKQRIPALIFALATCLIKEDAAVYVAFFALFLLFSEKEKKDKLFGGGLFLLAIAYFLLASSLLTAFGQGTMNWRFSDYASDNNLVSVIVTAVKNPALILHNIVKEAKILYIIQMLLPLCALPLMTSKPSRLFLFCPCILINLMPSWQYQYNIYFQYHFGTAVFLILAAVLNFADFKPERRKVALPCAIVASLILFMGTTFTTYHHYITNFESRQSFRDKMNEAIELIPDDASVVASMMILTHLAERDVIYDLQYTTHIPECDYVALDLRYGKLIKGNEYASDTEWLLKNGWEQIHRTDGVVAIFYNPNPIPAQQAE